MKKIILGILIVGQGAFATPAKLIPTSLATLVEKVCGSVEGDLNDLAACPTVEKYQFKKLTLPGVQAFFKAEKYHSFKVTSETIGLQVIKDSLHQQVNVLWDTLLEGEDESAQAAQAYVDGVPRMIAAFTRAAKGKQILVDPSTYWAPSVNARAIAIVDYSNNTVIVITHGDTDG